MFTRMILFLLFFLFYKKEESISQKQTSNENLIEIELKTILTS